MISLCENCRWYLGNHECVAFAEKIPNKIWHGQHKVVIEGQLFDFVYKVNNIRQVVNTRNDTVRFLKFVFG